MNNNNGKISGKDAKAEINFLDLALDIEDQMGGDIYAEFLNREIWPVNLSDDSFRAIEELLNILIKETAEHKTEFLNLKNKLNDNNAAKEK